MGRYCESIREWRGNKSNVIRDMVNEIEERKANRNARKLADDIGIEKMRLVAERAAEIQTESKKKFDEACSKHNIHYSSEYDSKAGKYVSRYKASGCFVPKDVFKKLTEANRLWALGMKKKANEYWNSVIEEYDLVHEAKEMNKEDDKH